VANDASPFFNKAIWFDFGLWTPKRPRRPTSSSGLPAYSRGGPKTEAGRLLLLRASRGGIEGGLGRGFAIWCTRRRIEEGLRDGFLAGTGIAEDQDIVISDHLLEFEGVQE